MLLWVAAALAVAVTRPGAIGSPALWVLGMIPVTDTVALLLVVGIFPGSVMLATAAACILLAAASAGA